MKAGITAGTIVTGILVWLFATVWREAWHGIASFFLGSPLFWGVMVVIIVIGLVALAAGSDGAGISVGILAVVWLIVGGFFQGYMNDRAIYDISVNQEEGKSAEDMSFNQRVPFDVASAVSNRSLGDTSGEATGQVKSVPATNIYTTSVVRRGIFQGYESVQSLNLPLYGTFNFEKSIKFCSYSEDAKLRVGGMGINNNIAPPAYRKVSAMNPTIKFNKADAFAICEGDTPMLYLPMTKIEYKGLAAYRAPAGVVTYNGKTAEMVYHKDMTVDGLPIYPMSVATAQRESLNTKGGMWNYMIKAVGYETTAKDGDDVNSPNNADFALATKDTKETLYTSPLTPRGSSSSVVALSTVPSETVKNGQLNTLTVNEYKSPRQSPSTVASNIITSQLEGYRAAGMQVFEVIPSADGSWTASIGKDQSTLYRAIIQANGDTVLYGSDGKPINGKESTPETGETPTPDISTGKNLADMNVDELKNLGNQIMTELSKRATPTE